MKIRTSVSIMILVLSVFIIAGGSKKEDLHGIWINDEYKTANIPFAILIFDFDGTYQYNYFEAASWEADVERTEEGWITGFFGQYKIAEKRIDDDGNIWYKIEMYAGATLNHHVLVRISGSSNILEYVYRKAKYAEDIDPNTHTYGIYYRQ